MKNIAYTQLVFMYVVTTGLCGA